MQIKKSKDRIGAAQRIKAGTRQNKRDELFKLKNRKKN
jgi:hypothetical protein